MRLLKLICVMATTVSVPMEAQPPLSMDTSFRTEIQWRYVSDIEFLDDGQLLVSGELNFPGMLAPYVGLARLNSDGSRDDTFNGSAGGGMLVPWSNNYYVGVGTGIKRLLQDGTLDVPYNNPIPYNANQGGGFHVYPDGTVLLTGSRNLRDTVNFQVYQTNVCLTKLDINGQPDTSFVHRSCSNGYARFIHETPDGKFLLSGSQSFYDGHAVGNILRIHPDGSLDTTFQNSVNYGAAVSYYFLPDGRFLAAGVFTMPEYPNDTLEVIRLMPDGTVDMSWPILDFRQTGAFYAGIGTVSNLLELELGKLLATGLFWDLDGEAVGGIAVIDTSGNILQQYFTGAGCDTVISPSNIITRYISRAEYAPDGSLYMYGSYKGFDDGFSYDPGQRLITKLFPLNVGLEEPIISTKATITVYPNPGSDLVQVSWPSDWGRLDVTLHDATGRTIQKRYEQTAPARLECADLSAGYYSILLAQRGQQRGVVSWLKQE
jgi:uncharacterized delta-60 repeat protein